MNGIGWFQVGVDDAAAAHKFYGEVFGWTFAGDDAYQLITTPDPSSVQGGLAIGQSRHATFFVVVDDVPAACKRVEAGGGSVLVEPKTTDAGLTFAHITDPEGNQVGIFSRQT